MASPQSPPQMISPETLGAFLKQLRQSKHLTIPDAADELCLSSSIIHAIEADDYFGEHNTIFMRGYIRSYARFLEIPLSVVESAFLEKHLVAPQESVDPFVFQGDKIVFKRKTLRIITTSILGVLLLLVMTWWYLHS